MAIKFVDIEPEEAVKPKSAKAARPDVKAESMPSTDPEAKLTYDTPDQKPHGRKNAP